MSVEVGREAFSIADACRHVFAAGYFLHDSEEDYVRVEGDKEIVRLSVEEEELEVQRPKLDAIVSKGISFWIKDSVGLRAVAEESADGLFETDWEGDPDRYRPVDVIETDEVTKKLLGGKPLPALCSEHF